MIELTNETPLQRDNAAQTPLNRLLALDIVRGYAMLLMLISHSAWWIDDLNYGVGYGWDNRIIPTLSLPESIPGFILQLATPAFFLLSGFSILLFAAAQRKKGWSEWQITRFLFIRGLLLITLDLTVMNLRFDPPYYGTYTSVLTGMGICVCAMALLHRLDKRILVVIMLVVLVSTQAYFHELVIKDDFPKEESLLRAVLITPSVADITWKSQFPALPWLPVVILGFLAGSQVIEKGVSLLKLSLKLGVGCLILFVGFIFAGDIASIYPSHPLIFGKHPPDLSYILLYTGITFLLIALHTRFESINTKPFMKMVVILGQGALFFYLIHIRLIEFVSPIFVPLPIPPVERSLLIVGTTLPILLVLCVVYRLSKKRHPKSILRYL